MESSIEFWRSNNLWRMICFPILYILVLMVCRNLFWQSAEIPVHVVAKVGGGQCLLISNFPDRAAIQIYFVTMFIIAIIEVTTPSLIHNMKPKYSDRQRIWYAVLHSFAWTSLGLGISQLFRMVVC